MYLVTVILLMLVLPAASIIIDHLNGAAPLLMLMGKWFVFWAVGVRLLLAGIRQFFQPGFTAKEIFGINSDEVLPLVRELGIANFATGTVGIASLWNAGFVAPVAISAGIFYGIAGIRHAMAAHRTFNENIAMASDLFVFLVLAGFLAWQMV